MPSRGLVYQKGRCAVCKEYEMSLINGRKSYKLRQVEKKVKKFNDKKRRPRFTPSRKSRNEFYQSREWQLLRYDTLRKYGFSCMACGAKPPTTIQVDHIKPINKYPSLRFKSNNLQVLCIDCNLGKSNLSEEDHRPLTSK